MILIIGLGNPGREYVGTRHNIGFEVIDRLSCEHTISVTKSKHRALIGEGVIFGQKVVLVKPQTYMNLSGESIRALIEWYKVKPKDILIVYDDISLAVGDLRIREKGSAGGHNGIKNTIYQLGTEEFPRIRVGVGEKPTGWDLADYVLSRFSKQEVEESISGMIKASEAVEVIIKTGIGEAMNQYNQRKKG